MFLRLRPEVAQGPERATCQLGPLSPPPLTSARGLGGWRDLLEGGRGETGQSLPKAVGQGSRGTMLSPPLQVSWAAPSRPSDTAPTTSKSSTISEVPLSRYAPSASRVPSHCTLGAAATSPRVYSQDGQGRGGIPECRGHPEKAITHVCMTGTQCRLKGRARHETKTRKLNYCPSPFTLIY